MNPFSSISQIYKRWRHSRGFGVHSPFAYDLVTNAVTPGNYAFYGYEDIERALLMPDALPFPHLRHDARLLLRLLVFVGKKRLLIYPSAQTVAERVATAVGIQFSDLTPDILSSVSHSDMILLRKDMPFKEGVTRSISSGAAIMALDPSRNLCEHLKASMKDGLILEGKRTIIAIPREEMVLTYYSMRL